MIAKWLAASLLLAISQASAAPALPAVVADVKVMRSGGLWTADFHFAEAAPAWVLARSPLAAGGNRSWRADSWVVETPGVRLERHGWYDVLVAEKGNVPKRVRIRFTPYSKEIETGYDPALVFTDGSVALYDEQFKTFPVTSTAVAGQLPIDMADQPGPSRPTRVTFRDAGGRVLHAGRRLRSVSLADAGTYVLFGPARPIVTDAMATIMDTKLPPWLHAFLGQETPEILADYTSRLGPTTGAKPTLMVSWAGPTKGVYSMGGSVLPGLVLMRFEGEGVVEEKPGARHFARWFIAHEAAHFWLGQTVRYEFSRDAWITEGGADLLAIRTVAATDQSYDPLKELQRAVDDCVKLSDGRGVSSAQERNEHRAYYACGAVIALAVEGASKKSFAAWLRPLLDANRADGILSRAEWLAAVDDPRLHAAIEDLLDHGSKESKAAIANLLTLGGIPFERAGDGTPRLK